MMKNGIQLNNRKLVNTILYSDDQILTTTSKDELQTMAHYVNLLARKYKMTISSIKTKSMTMWRNHIQRVKIVIKDNIIQQVTDFKYLGYRISEYKSDFRRQIANIQQNKRRYTETFWKTNEKRNKIKNSQHCS